jgi:hypothetical protein
MSDVEQQSGEVKAFLDRLAERGASRAESQGPGADLDRRASPGWRRPV